MAPFHLSSNLGFWFQFISVGHVYHQGGPYSSKVVMLPIHAWPRWHYTQKTQTELQLINGHHVADMTDGDTKITYNTEITLITAQCTCDYVAHVISHPTW